MKSDFRRGSTSIGALTRKDHYREATLKRKIDDCYRSMSSTSSTRLRRRLARDAHRHERALTAQRRRPQSALRGLAILLLGAVVAVVVTGAPSGLAVIAATLLFFDWQVLRLRRRRLQRD